MYDFFSKTFSARKASTDTVPVEVAVEYLGHVWIISVRNPGQKEWVTHKSAHRKVAVFNHLNEKIKEVPAIEVYASRAQATEFLKEHIPCHRVVTRSPREIEELFARLRGPAQ